MKICIVGAGFYGLRISFFLKNAFPSSKIVVLEKNSSPCREAIANNQHRLHLGFHYPRCEETISQCVETFDQFSKIYENCVEEIENNYYIVHKDSNVNSDDFSKTMSKFDIYHEISKEAPSFLHLKNIGQYESFFKTNERKINLNKISSRVHSDAVKSGVEILYNKQVLRILEDGTVIGKDFNEKFDFVINCSYTNQKLLDRFETETKSEICFMGLLRPKNPCYNKFSSTICDGPFSSLYPADNGNFTISNVIKTPAMKSSNVFDLYDIKSKLTENDKLKICEEIILESEKYFNIKDNFDLIGSYCSIKTKILHDVNDYRGTFFTRQGKVINVISGKIQACLLIEKQLKEEILS